MQQRWMHQPGELLPQSPVRRRNLVLRTFLIWTLLNLVYSLMVYLRSTGGSSDSPTLIQIMGSIFTDQYLWMLLSPLIFAMVHRYGTDQGSWASSITRHLFVAGVLSSVQIFLFVCISTPARYGRWVTSADFRHGFVRLGAEHYSLGLLTYAIIALLAVGLNHRNQKEAALLRSAELENQLTQAKLLALRMQLNPHFLFNTLHTISSLVTQDPATARKMTVRLGSFLRMTLDGNGDPLVPLDQELTFIRHYLAIEQVRLGNSLKVNEHIDPGLGSHLVPNLILQPLVENAIRHGISTRPKGGSIDIIVRRKEDRLTLVVRDDGEGLKEDSHWRVGLQNVRDRLSGIYGDQASIEVRGRPDAGTEAVVSIPFAEEEAS